MPQTSYVPLEPSSLPLFGSSAANFGTISTSFSSVTTFLWMLSFSFIVGAAFYQLILAGGVRMRASEADRRKSNEMIKRVTLGLLGVFSLFLILFTINRQMLTGDVGLSDLVVTKETSASTGSEQTIPPSTRARDNPPIPKNNDDPLGWGAIKNDSSVRAMLASLPSGGIGVNRSVCIDPVQTSCTTVGGFPPNTITMLKDLRSTCSGTITITGGTETGHKSHGPGKTPVDLSLSSPGGLEACIRSFPQGPAVSFCRVTYQKFGYTFCDEYGVRHWHIYQ